MSPTYNPSYATASPTTNPTTAPSNSPTVPTSAPTDYPTVEPTIEPTAVTIVPTTNPTAAPTNSPTVSPTSVPTFYPTNAPTIAPTLAPTRRPTQDMEVKEETTVPGGDRVEPKTIDGDNSHSAFVDRNLYTIIYVLSALLFCTCVVVIILCYAERRKRQGSNKSGLKQPLLDQTNEYPSLPRTQSSQLIGEYDTEGVELGSVRWIDHRLSSIVANTGSIGSSDENEDSDSEVLYNMEENRTADMATPGNTKGHEDVNKEKEANENDDGDSSSDSLYDYHASQPTMGETLKGTGPQGGNQCEYVLETPM
eukprot:188214_1